MTTNLTRRRCNGKTCVAFLSSYNDDPEGLCGPCRKTQTEREIEAEITRLRDQMDERDPVIVPETRAGTQMCRVLRAMPASAREIAESTGLPLDKARVTARDAVKSGRAERRKRKREGSHGEVSEYVCLVELPPPSEAENTPKPTSRERVRLSFKEGPKSAGELSESLGLDRRYISRIIREMVEDGWLSDVVHLRKVPGGNEHVYSEKERAA